MGKRVVLLLVFCLPFFLISCSFKAAKLTQATDKGIGPIKNLKLGPINLDLAKKGETLFQMHCTQCHHLNHRYVGPPLGKIATTARPEFIMNMILNPEGMTQKDPIAHKLLAKYLTQMSVKGITRKDARAILEYLRSVAEKNHSQK